MYKLGMHAISITVKHAYLDSAGTIGRTYEINGLPNLQYLLSAFIREYDMTSIIAANKIDHNGF
jgi:hypothetical protein